MKPIHACADDVGRRVGATTPAETHKKFRTSISRDSVFPQDHNASKYSPQILNCYAKGKDSSLDTVVSQDTSRF